MTEISTDLPSSQLKQSGRPLLAILFFASGGCALVFQVVWMRELSLVFGVTAYASSAVLTAYMLGLTLGSLAFGWVVDRIGKPWRLLGFLELGIALCALLFPLGLGLLKAVYLQLWPLAPGYVWMSLARLVMAVLILLPPTLLMGGTLPVAVAAFSPPGQFIGRDAGWMYTVNNLGAVVGSGMAGFIMIEHCGVNGTAQIGVAIETAVGLTCLLWAHGHEAGPPSVDAARPAGFSAWRPLSNRLKIALWVFAIQGFISMALELLWVRMLVVFMGNNVYVFSTILSVLLLGLTAGSYWMTRRLPRSPDLLRTLVRLQYGLGLSAIASIIVLGAFGSFRNLGLVLIGENLGAVILGNLAPALVVVFLPALCTGATLPLIAGLYREDTHRPGSRMGFIGFLDTAGSVLGAPAAAFIILPWCGIKGGIAALAGLSLALGILIRPLARDRKPLRSRLVPIGAVLLIFVALVYGAGLNRPLIKETWVRSTSQPAASGSVDRSNWKTVFDEALSTRLLNYCEGREAVVSVVEEAGIKALAVDGIACSDDSLFDRPSHTMIIHLPLLLVPEPKDVLLIGLGIGFTTQAARQYGVGVDVVELEACELSAHRAFRDAGLGILSDPKVRVVIDDGRNYVLATDRKYSVVQAGIIHPAFSSGNAGFYTLDFYRQCQRILRPGGVFSQWLPLFGMSESDFKMLVRTFQAAFPHTTAWYKWLDDSVVLIGTPEPLRIDWGEFSRRAELPAVRADLDISRAGGVLSLLDSFLMDEDTVRSYVGEGPLHTDEHPLMEFTSARVIRPNSFFVLRGLAPFRRPVLPYLSGLGDYSNEASARLNQWYAGTQEVIAGQIVESRLPLPEEGDAAPDLPGYQEALDHYTRAVALDPADDNARFHGAMLNAQLDFAKALVALRNGDKQQTLEWLRRCELSSPGSRFSNLAHAIIEKLSHDPVSDNRP